MIMNERSMVEELLNRPPYDGSEECDNLFIEALRDELVFHYEHNEMYRHFCERKNFNPHEPIHSVDELPPVAVSVFKELGFNLNSVPREELTLALQSSATSGIPSTVVIDKITAKRQGKAMVKVVSEFIGKERKPFLIMDIDPRSASRKLLGARFAAVTGYLKFASKVGYFLKADENGLSYFDVEGIQAFIKELPSGQPVVVFGFTYILYQHVLKSILESDVRLHLPEGSKIIHIGGWKKLESEKISKELFNEQLARCFGICPEDVIDIYGFTEQMGLNYPDCACGCKHASSYVKVLARDTVTRSVLPAGKEGMLEFITPIPHSYPGNVVLTDDIGILEDSPCPYGRPGQRFRIVGRLKKAEVITLVILFDFFQEGVGVVIFHFCTEIQVMSFRRILGKLELNNVRNGGIGRNLPSQRSGNGCNLFNQVHVLRLFQGEYRTPNRLHHLEVRNEYCLRVRDHNALEHISRLALGFPL